MNSSAIPTPSPSPLVLLTTSVVTPAPTPTASASLVEGLLAGNLSGVLLLVLTIAVAVGLFCYYRSKGDNVKMIIDPKTGAITVEDDAVAKPGPTSAIVHNSIVVNRSGASVVAPAAPPEEHKPDPPTVPKPTSDKHE